MIQHWKWIHATTEIRCSDAKITFPGCFTTTCCSPPLSNIGKLEENDADWSKKSSTEIFKGWIRNSHESGSSRRINYLTQIHSKAQSGCIWGEHEIDSFCLWGGMYFWFQSTVSLRAISYVSKEEIKELLVKATSGEIRITPWFQIIVELFHFKWWEISKLFESVLLTVRNYIECECGDEWLIKYWIISLLNLT